jgi:hypothetical protein
MRVVYIAHPLGDGPMRERNRRNASRWVAWIAQHFDVAPVADWIILSEYWDESMRLRGLAIDGALVRRCYIIILVGGRISNGMQYEIDVAREDGIHVVDLTGLGWRAPRLLSQRLVPKVRDILIRELAQDLSMVGGA